MTAMLVLRERYQIGSDAFVETRVWRVPTPVKGSDHHFKYSLVLVVADMCVLRYDNEAGKGDHRHIGSFEEPYRFTSLEQLIADFKREVDEWQPK